MLNNNLGGNTLIYNESEDAYYIQHGADTGLKKLGSSRICIPYLQFPDGQAGTGVARWQTLKFDITNFSSLSFHVHSPAQTGTATTSSFTISGLTSIGVSTPLYTITSGADDNDYSDIDISKYTVLEISTYLYCKDTIITNLVCE